MSVDDQDATGERHDLVEAEIEAYAYESVREDIRIGEEQIKRGEFYTTEEVKEIFRQLRLKREERNNQRGE